MRIGELAVANGLTLKTIRFYEQAGLLPAPPRTPGGYRDYPPQVGARLAFVRDAQSAGLTLAEIRSILSLGAEVEENSSRVGVVRRHADRVPVQPVLT
ncbi:MerR family transcriptional regulator [Streptomyces sp. NPDC051572]|uniref:MerR family transcriptional regulator n=1 Tax=Streptomyces sp. NPDC051572 TaxID=3155802 RepID=UPI00344BA077